VEAMHCKRLAIVTDVAGNAEVVKDGLSGFVAEAATVQHLNQAMERAWEQRHRWRQIGEMAGCWIRELVPSDPGAVFAQTLLRLVDVNKSSECEGGHERVNH
ncbi:MAG: glycosyltransferase, partial [Limisphaerales bacterium]